MAEELEAGRAPEPMSGKTRAKDVRGDAELCRQVDYVFDPTRRELGPVPCEGARVPEGFPAGTYLRNGPNSKYGIGKEHFFDGDGMVHGMSFLPGGEVTYFNRWVEGIGYKREAEAGKKLYEGVLVNDGWGMLAAVLKNILFQSALETSGAKDTANTAIVSHAGKVLALMEAQKPTLMDLQLDAAAPSLGTKEVGYDFDGDLLGNFTAHPKVDPSTGTMCLFSYDMTSKPHLRYSEVDAKGRVAHSVGVYNLDRGVMSHDMAITETHAVLFDLPVYFDAANIFVKGEFPVQYQREAPSRLGLIERGGSEVQWFDVASGGNVFHTFNAYNCEETGQVVLHAMRSEPEKDGYIFNDYSPSYLHEWRIDPERGSVREARLGAVAGEFPCINPNFVGRKAEFGYIARDGLLGSLQQWQYPPIGITYDAIVKHELATGEVVDTWDCSGSGLHLFEPQFVPREEEEGGRSGKEDDGFLVLFSTDAKRDKSFFVILDASDLASGPAAMIEVPQSQKVCSGLHGCWIPLAKKSLKMEGAT